jgi:hypothetical protein
MIISKQLKYNKEVTIIHLQQIMYHFYTLIRNFYIVGTDTHRERKYKPTPVTRYQNPNPIRYKEDDCYKP